MTSFSSGQQAEKAAAKYLQEQGFDIIAQNWRTRFCEIDIVAQKDGSVHFAEVKYRQNNSQGSGLEYITPKKLKQMSFAAEMWVNNNSWDGAYTLSAIEVSGKDFEVSSFIADLA